MNLKLEKTAPVLKICNVILMICFLLINIKTNAQEPASKSHPFETNKAIAFSVGTLLDLPLVNTKVRNTSDGELSNKYISRNVPIDPSKALDVDETTMQIAMGTTSANIIQNWDAISTTASATDCNGAVGPNHYLQSVNFSFSIFDKVGNSLMGPSTLNTFFEDITPAESEGKGDPVVIYDEHANRFLIAQFASGPYDPSYTHTDPNYIFVAVSQTADPTGAWYKWAFVVNAFPDYFKIGVGENGYFIGSNPYYHPDASERFMVMDRVSMLAGDANPQLITFESNQIPGLSNQVFHVVQPVDTDGPFAPAGSPGVFITINDNVWGGNDELWIYEMNVDWNNTSNSTIERTQTISVEPFASQFNTSGGGFFDIDCIIQKGSDVKLDAVPTVLMYRAQYRNFNGNQKVICYHTVNVDGQNQAGLRWYELEKSTGDWFVRQQGTYAPDENSRWMGGIGMNGDMEIAIGYSIASADLFPGIRFSGQSNAEHQNASGILDIEETIVFEGFAAKTSNSRWVDYTNLTIDPTDDHTFWYTNSYVKNAYENGTYITAFEFTEQSMNANFSADNTTPTINTRVNFSDESTGNIDSWDWSFSPSTVEFVGGTSSGSQNPQLLFTQAGIYSVSLEVSDGFENDQEIKRAYINTLTVGITGNTPHGLISVYSDNENNIHCKTTTNFVGNITIYDASGRVVYSKQISDSPFRIDKTGFFIVRVEGKGEYYSGKIVLK